MKILLFIFVCLISSTCLFATIINIPADQATIQGGIDVSVDTDTVLVQPGTYVENINYNGKNITLASLFLTTQDTTYISQTVIDGNQNGSVVKFESYEDSTALLTGLTITNGAALGGGGIYCGFHTSPSLVNVTITGNSAVNGGGIRCSQSTPSLENVNISDNSANRGGGLYCYISDPSLQNTTITDNSAWRGGGIDCQLSTPSLVNVQISGNTASSSGGGIYCCYNSNLCLVNVTITGNSTGNRGGGIYCRDNSNLGFSVDNRCSIYSNTIGSTRGFGADIFAYECDIIDVIVDTFTVMTPTDYYASSIDNFTFDILHCVIDSLIDADVYVSVDGDDSNSGISPELSFKTVSHALDIIYADSMNIHTVHLAPGVYSNSTNGETFPISWSSYVNLSGNSEDETILDAEGTSEVIDFYGVTNAIISNITITNGNYSYGGGIYCSNSDPILQNVTISDNYAEFSGGGISCYDYSSPSLINVTISGNSAGIRGGGIYCLSSSPILQNVTISDNSGNGIYCQNNSNPILQDVTISGNSSSSGGGIYMEDSSPSLENVTISCNSAADQGGGIYCSNSDPILQNVTISDNSGNGIYCQNNSNPILQDVTISDNSGNGIYCQNNSNPILQDVTISGNSSSSSGGGIYMDDSSPSLENVTISCNSAADQGGGIYCSSSNPTLENVAITGNSADDHGGGIYCGNSSPSFSIDNRCSIYSNTIGSTRGFGADIFAIECDVIDVIVDTFTVMPPTDYYASPIDNFTFDILHCVIDSLIDADVYVSVDGDDSNSGIYPDSPFKTINHALSRIYFDSLNIHTIHLAPGAYSNSTNGEIFPIYWSNFVNLSGSSEEETILDAEGTSGVMEFYAITDATISNITITNGNYSYGGGISCSDSSPTLENITISDNTAFGSGGGINCDNSSPILQDVTISGNSASSGGGIYCENSDPILQDVTITGNTAVGYFGWGGGGGIECDNSSPSLQNVTISGNTAALYDGGGINCNNSSPILQNVTISGNSAGTYGHGGGINCDYSSPSFINSILWDNLPEEIYGSATARYSDIQGGWVGEGNIDEDPLFANPSEDDFHLTENSPCIDAGDPFYQPDPDGTPADMGACYFHHTGGEQQVWADFYADTTVVYMPLPINFYDLSVAFNTEITTWLWDFENDGTIDSNEQNPSHTYQDIGYYSVSLTVEDDNGNSNTIIKTDFIMVYPPHYISHIWHITPDGSDEFMGNGSPGYPFATIQRGITVAENGDTVLVHPGTYLENINYSGKNIIIGSLFLTTQDTTYTSQTIIDGNQNGSVVEFGSGENSNAVLYGFTITNGTALMGGGIYCNNSNPILQNVTITGNSAYYGGGIHCIENSNPNLQNVTITGNSATDKGGGIYCRDYSNPSLENVTISGNSADWFGGGICCSYNSNPVVINSILWNNSPQEVYFYNTSYSNSITISYSDIQGGEAGIVTNNNGTVNWLEGNIDADPLFVGNGEHPYLLLEDSPCIDSGIPDTTGLNLPPWDIIGNYRIWDGDGNGSEIIDMGAYEYGSPPYTDVDEPTIPSSSLLIHNLKNYPNPFNPETVISFQISDVSNQETKIEIYNVKGQKIVTLSAPMQSECIEGRQGSTYSVIWNGTDQNNQPVSSGIYFYKLKAGNFEQIRKMMIMK